MGCLCALGSEGYDGYGGLYQGGLNLQIYWDDNADKLKRFVDTLSQGDILFMSSNRQWASVTRVPERYPLTTAYYRALIGCPADRDVIWCYNVAKPGMFQGQLGYKLVAVFESFPTIDIPGVFKWEANDQFAEEAFTVYDHPKVLIFQKQPDFSAAQVQNILGAVDLSNVVHLTPRQASSYKSLMLRLGKPCQAAGGRHLVTVVQLRMDPKPISGCWPGHLVFVYFHPRPVDLSDHPPCIAGPWR